MIKTALVDCARLRFDIVQLRQNLQVRGNDETRSGIVAGSPASKTHTVEGASFPALAANLEARVAGNL